MSMTLEGPAQNLGAFVIDLQKELDSSDFSIRPVDELDSAVRGKQGIDPFVYLAIVFGGHLAGALAHDAIVAIVKKVSKKHGYSAEDE